MAQADFERMEEINQEIGLTQMLRGMESPDVRSPDEMEKEKVEEQHAEAAR